MNRETIEKAAKDYAYKTWAGGGFECASEDSFIAGAEWRINAVWHGAKEVPEREDDFVLVEYMDWGASESEYGLVASRNYPDVFASQTYCDVVRWAYVSDLIPRKKGGKQ